MTIAIIAGLSAGIPGIVASVLGFLKLNKKADETHDLVNSRVTELLDLTRKSSKAEGVLQEHDRAGTSQATE